jgi:hypothetical protein
MMDNRDQPGQDYYVGFNTADFEDRVAIVLILPT